MGSDTWQNRLDEPVSCDIANTLRLKTQFEDNETRDGHTLARGYTILPWITVSRYWDIFSRHAGGQWNRTLNSEEETDMDARAAYYKLEER